MKIEKNRQSNRVIIPANVNRISGGLFRKCFHSICASNRLSVKNQWTKKEKKQTIEIVEEAPETKYRFDWPLTDPITLLSVWPGSQSALISLWFRRLLITIEHMSSQHSPIRPHFPPSLAIPHILNSAHYEWRPNQEQVFMGAWNNIRWTLRPDIEDNKECNNCSMIVRQLRVSVCNVATAISISSFIGCSIHDIFCEQGKITTMEQQKVRVRW